jgi:hypothetical protein
MISITCTNCQTLLSIDDAFAGGVCRCQHCGTIQTVPSKKKEGAGATAAGLGVKTPKTLYQKRTRDASVGTGLDELAEVVTSSGLVGSGLSSSSSRAARPPGGAAVEQKNNLTVIVGIAAIVVIALLIVILVVVMQNKGGSGGGTVAQRTSGGTGGSPGLTKGASPTFAGIPLNHPSVIYLLDRGSSTQAPFGSLKEATLRSIQSLGPERRFQIIFWDNAQDAGTFPPLLTYASEANVTNVRRQIEDVYAFGATDAAPALKKAVGQRPDAIVLVTGKGADLDDSFVQMVNDVKKDVPVIIHTVAINGSGQSTALKRVAGGTGGEYRELSEAELSKYGQ